MAIVRKLVDPTIIIDNLVVAYIPNSLELTEGFGEQKLRIQTGGGGSRQQVLADDVSKKQSNVKFKMEPTADNIDFLRAIKSNLDGHVITISAPDMTRTITGALLVNDYVVKMGAEGEIDLEFVGNSAI